MGIVPAHDTSLRYVLPVPRGWGRVEALAASPQPGRPEILGVFAPEADLTGPRIIVSATRLQWDVDPQAWVEHHWTQAGWSIAIARPLEARWHPRFEVGALRRIEGAVEVRRTTGWVDNGRLMRVDVAAPSSRWASLHDLLWPCGVLCSLTKPTYRREVEAQRRVGGPLVGFGLPASWHARPAPPPRPDANRWVASAEDGVGVLRVDAMPWRSGEVESYEARRERLRRELRAEGLALARRVQRIPPGAAAGTPGLAGLFEVQARDHDHAFDVRIAHVDADGVSLDYVTAVASPECLPLDRMRTNRALELAVASTQIRPNAEESHAA
ncbi:MAG: hypothetical protein K0V04_28235 [Deltaproteobacteria bacterium]|nr:hypothetical protein [Deltaproteobacteria bacterium]